MFYSEVASTDISLDGLSTLLVILLFVVGILIAIAGIFAAVMSIYLFFQYYKYNRQKTEAGVIGCDVARKLLDENGLENIKVKKGGLFTTFVVGNSYSHYFKRVRLRGLIHSKASLTSVAISGQKVGLAVLDKEKDPDMVKRIRLLPIITFGPIAFIPLILIGFLLDILIFNTEGVFSLIVAIIAVLFYFWSFALSMAQLKTEKKAQDRAIKMLTEYHYLTESEVEDAKHLYHLYNINYVVDAVISLLQAIYELLKLALKIAQQSKKSNN